MITNSKEHSLTDKTILFDDDIFDVFVFVSDLVSEVVSQKSKNHKLLCNCVAADGIRCLGSYSDCDALIFELTLEFFNAP